MLTSQRNARISKRVCSEPRGLAPAGSPTPEMVAGSFKSSYSQTLLRYPINDCCVNSMSTHDWTSELHQNSMRGVGYAALPASLAPSPSMDRGNMLILQSRDRRERYRSENKIPDC